MRLPGAIALFLIAAVLFPAPPASAVVSVASELHEFYDGCIAKFTAAGMRDKVDQLDRSKKRFKFVRGSGTVSNPDDRSLAQDPKKGSGGETTIDPNNNSRIPGQYPPVSYDPCATLYHEMSHLVFYDNGTDDEHMCAEAPAIPINEVEATREENRYRRTQPDLKEYLRTSYYGHEMPGNEIKCKRGAPPPRPTGGCNFSGVDGPTCAVSNGDPHLTTFDQLHYDFQAVGEFLAVQSTTRGDLEVQVRQAAMDGSPDASVNTAVAMKLAGANVGIYMTDGSPKLLVNGVPRTLDGGPIALSGSGLIQRLGTDELAVIWPDGSEVLIYQIGRYGFRLGVNLARDRRGSVVGLLGNFDGNPENDLRMRDGSAIIRDATFENLYPRFSDSWRVTQAESLFRYDAGQSTQSFTNKRLPTRPLDAEALPNRREAEAVCRRAGVQDSRLLQDCILDVGISGDASFAKSAANTEKVFLRRASARVSTSGPGLRLSGRISGQLSPAVADCTIIEAAQQFSMVMTGTVNDTKVELYVNVTEGFHGGGTYAVGSILGNGALASLSYGTDSFATDSGQPGNLRVNPDSRSGNLSATLERVEVSGQWACRELTRL